MRFTTISAVLAVALVAACSSPESQPAPAALEAPAPGEGFQLSTPEWSLVPGEERIMCLFTTVPGDPGEEIWINRIEMGMYTGSHHLLIYRDISEFIPGANWEEGWRECEMDSALPFAGSQVEYANEVYPDGVAFKLTGGMKIAIESHYINYWDDNIDALASINFFTTEKAEVDHQAGSYITYKEGFTVPIGAGLGGEPDHVEELVCPVPEVEGGVNFFGLSSHMHWHGREFNAWTHDLGSATDSQHVYTNTNWSDPARLSYIEDPIVMTADQGFRYACSYFNDTGEVVTEGPSADNEMCMLIGSYYPVADSPFGLDGIAVCLDGELYY